MKIEQHAKDLQDSLELTREAGQHLNTLIGSLGDGFLVTDKSDRIVLVNKAAEQLFGIPAKDLVGMTLQGLLAGYAPDVIDLKIVEPASDVRRFEIELPGQAPQGNRIFQVTSLPVYDPSGAQFEGAVTLFHDVSRDRELDRLKSEFFSAAAHELRTPLTSIRGFSELLLERNFSEEEQKKFLLYINQQSKQLTHIINDLLDVSSETSQDLSGSHPPGEK
ncbi:MAG: PAS domain-containing protein [Desulfobulbaceae bacterium]|nr:PAS domain-containing protein [Desulfobulbaceae bacterium]